MRPTTRGERRATTDAKVAHKVREYVAVTGRRYARLPSGRPILREPGTLRKGHHWLACGQTRCFCCHGPKLLHIPRPRDVKRLQAAYAEVGAEPLPEVIVSETDEGVVARLLCGCEVRMDGERMRCGEAQHLASISWDELDRHLSPAFAAIREMTEETE